MLFVFPVVQKGKLVKIVTDHIELDKKVSNPNMRVLVPLSFAERAERIAEKMIGTGAKVNQTIGFSADSRVNKVVAPSSTCDLTQEQEVEMKDQLEKYSMMFK